MATAYSTKIWSGDGDVSLASATSRPVTIFIPLTGGATDSRVVENSQNDEHLNNNRSITALRNFGTNTTVTFLIDNQTTMTNEIPSTDDVNLVLIVGVACGAVGLFLGMIFTAVFCRYRNRTRHERDMTRPSQLSVFGKNPKEKTFEPLDLSLTLPSYERSDIALDRRETSNDTLMGSSLPAKKVDCSENEYSGAIETSPTATVSKYRDRFEAFSRGADFYEIKPDFMLRERQQQKKMSLSDESDPYYDSRKSPFSTRRNYIEAKPEWEKRPPVTVSARESFSSGLGTGTESDVYPCENKSSNYLPITSSINKDLIIRSDELQSTDKPSSISQDLNRRSRSHSLVSVVTDGGQNQKCFSAKSKQKRRLTNPSNKTLEKDKCSNINSDPSVASLCSLFEDRIPSPKMHNSTFSDSEKTSKAQQDALQDFEISSVKSTDGTENGAIKDSDPIQTANSEIVSTYFNLHFPFSLNSSDSRAKIEKEKTDALEILNSKFVVMNDDPDDTINL